MPRVAVVGATGAVGGVMIDLLLERSFDDVQPFASARSAGTKVRGLQVEEATPDSLGGFDVCFFSVGAKASRELVPHAMRGGALCVDKSEAFRLQDGVPLVVPEVNGERALEHDGLIANPNCSTIPLTLVLKPLH
jgi:aspartate-semialdehyde dehydrogenase